jgi:hypothetical protein
MNEHVNPRHREVLMKGRLALIGPVAVAALAVAGVAYGVPSAALFGTRGNDTIYGTVHADAIFGRAGSDSLHGRAGNDVIYGNAGDDVIRGAEGNDVEYGGHGNDALWVGRGADAEFGGPGDDVLHALADDDRFDLVNCGPGNDSAWLNMAERGRYRIVGCERVNWIVPSAAQVAEETGD